VGRSRRQCDNGAGRKVHTMKHAGVFAAALALALAAPARAAQSKPDFSGRWTLVPDTAASEAGARGRGRGPVSGDMGSGWGPTITFAQDASTLTLEYDFFVRGDLQPPLTFSYRLDGAESRNTVRMGRGVQVQTSRTTWDGNALVIVETHTYADPVSGAPMTSDVIRRLSLESPTTLVVETTRSAVPGVMSETVRTVYQKQD